MTATLLLVLLGLALVDSTSVGTLFIPVWLLLAPGKIAVGRMLIYLGTIAAFYFVVGIALALGAQALAGPVAAALQLPAVRFGEFLIGAALLGWALWPERWRRQSRNASGRLTRWREEALDGSSSLGGLVGLALVAALTELATMLPYLGAIAALTAANVSLPMLVLLLAGYVLVMVLPALVLLAGRVAAASTVAPLLARINKWTSKNGRELTKWIVGLVGFFLLRDAGLALWAG